MIKLSIFWANHRSSFVFFDGIKRIFFYKTLSFIIFIIKIDLWAKHWHLHLLSLGHCNFINYVYKSCIKVFIKVALGYDIICVLVRWVTGNHILGQLARDILRWTIWLNLNYPILSKIKSFRCSLQFLFAHF